MSKWSERNRYRRGRWLVTDDESGTVHYSDQMVRRWDGAIVRASQDEPIDPQWFIRAKADPRPVAFVRPDAIAGPQCETRSPYDANNQLLKPFAGYSTLVGTGIGTFEIGCSFVVFPDGGPFPPTP